VSLQSLLSRGGLLTEYEEKDKALREKRREEIREQRWREHELLQRREAGAAHSQAVADDADRAAKEAERVRRQEAQIAVQEAAAAELRLLRDRVGWIREAIPSVPAVTDAASAKLAIEAHALRLAGEDLLARAERALSAGKRL
jgi:hypothetical protein